MIGDFSSKKTNYLLYRDHNVFLIFWSLLLFGAVMLMLFYLLNRFVFIMLLIASVLLIIYKLKNASYYEIYELEIRRKFYFKSVEKRYPNKDIIEVVFLSGSRSISQISISVVGEKNNLIFGSSEKLKRLLTEQAKQYHFIIRS